MLHAMKSRSQKNTSQLFYLSLIQEWRGCSRGGMDISGKTGTTLASKTFQRHKDLLLAKHDAKIAAIRQGTCCILWVDNFNKFYVKSKLLIRTNGPNINTDWTALGLSKLNFAQPMDLQHLMSGSGNFLTSFPDPLFRPLIYNPLWKYFKEYDNFIELYCWAGSISFSVFSTPIRLPIEPGYVQTQEELVYGSNIGLKNFQPIDLLDYNIASTAGLCSVLRQLRQKFFRPGHYLMLKVDINIYWRIAKVSLKLISKQKCMKTL